jgi:hypothetical protein
MMEQVITGTPICQDQSTSATAATKHRRDVIDRASPSSTGRAREVTSAIGP